MRKMFVAAMGLAMAVSGRVGADEDTWRLSVGGHGGVYTFAHDALQERRPTEAEEDSSALKWTAGETDGQAWGLKAALTKGPVSWVVTVTDGEYDYELLGSRVLHQIATRRLDSEAMRVCVVDRDPRGAWGYLLALKYIGEKKEIMIRERDSLLIDDGRITWGLGSVGAFGSWYPFQGAFGISGSIHALLGYVTGLCRIRSDLSDNGDVTNLYGDDSSVAYGAGGQIGLHYLIAHRLNVSVGYRATGLFSFGSTEDGDFTFPANGDALFMENHHTAFVAADLLF